MSSFHPFLPNALESVSDPLRTFAARAIADNARVAKVARMGRFLLICLVVGLLVAGAVFLLGPKWGGIITGGVFAFLIMQAVYQKRYRS